MMKLALSIFLIFFYIFINSTAHSQKLSPTVELTSKGVLIDGKYKILRGGSLQWFRIPVEEWEDKLIRFKAMGYNLIDMYAAWRNHEPEEAQFDFKTFDIVRFLTLVKKYGLYVYFRPGPYITNEMDGGGYPYWVRAKSDKRRYDPVNLDGTMNIRTDDKDFMDAVKKYYTALNKVIKPFLYTHGNGGGPIILYSVENELDWMYLSLDGDKFAESQIDGLPERPFEQTPNMTNYLSKLFDFARNTGINVPITTCPGDGMLGGMGNTTNIAPFPNIYFELKSTEFAVQKYRNAIRSEKSPYQSFPLGVTETTRDNWVLRRLLIAGVNIISQFNIFGYHQEGRMNAMALNMPLFYGYSSVKIMIEFMEKAWDLNNIAHVFRLPVGLFPGNIDMNAAVTASGLLRDKFHHIRRTNLFIDAFENFLVGRDSPFRTFQAYLPGAVPNSDFSIKVKSKLVGISDPDVKTAKVNYWLSLNHIDGLQSSAAILGLYNAEGENDLKLPLNSIEAFGIEFPKFFELTVPYERVDMVLNGEAAERRYYMFIPINVPIGKIVVEYSTSEILTFKNWMHQGKNRTILLLYNVDGSKAETSILSNESPEGVVITNAENKKIKNEDLDIQILQKNNSTKAQKPEARKDGKFQQSLLYEHKASDIKSIIYRYPDFDFQTFILDTDRAGKTWIIPHPQQEIIIIGPDLVHYNPVDMSMEIHVDITKAASETMRIKAISLSPVRFSKTVRLISYDPFTMLGEYELTNQYEGVPQMMNEVIDKVSIWSENIPTFLNKMSSNHPKKRNWINLENGPNYLEKLNVSGGHVWYEAEVELTQEDLTQKDLPLWGDSASDFISLYVNGQYILTLFPIGIEIDSTSWDKYIGFKIPMSAWKVGKNVLTFKVEVWGAGSFMFPNGRIASFALGNVKVKLAVSKVSLPAVGCESLKGLKGNFRVDKKALANWKFSAGLEHHPTSVPSSPMTVQTITYPLNLTEGKVYWFKTWIDASNKLPDPKTWYAPISLNVQGKNAKATIYLNGRIIGRWISDNDWLHRGNWANPVRDLWTWFVSVDDIPLSHYILHERWKKIHELIIAFEDVGDATQAQHGQIYSVSLVSSPEILTEEYIPSVKAKPFNSFNMNTSIGSIDKQKETTNEILPKDSKNRLDMFKVKEPKKRKVLKSKIYKKWNLRI